MLFFRLFSVADIGKDVEHLTQAVDGTENDSHHHWHHVTANTRLFSNSNMAFSRQCECLILTGKARNTSPFVRYSLRIKRIRSQ